MSPEDAASLVWAKSATSWGMWLVWFGVAIEGATIIALVVALFKRRRLRSVFTVLPEPHVSWKIELIGAAGWFILVIGLSFEIPGHTIEQRITEKENRRLEDELSFAVRTASEAQKTASANELHAAQLESANLLLQGRVEELKATNRQLSQLVFKLTPRQLSDNQSEWLARFLDSWDRTNDAPVRLSADPRDSEAYRFATDIRFALGRAGIFVTNIEPCESSVSPPLQIEYPFRSIRPMPLIAWRVAAGFSGLGFEPTLQESSPSRGVMITVGNNRPRQEYTREVISVNGAGLIWNSTGDSWQKVARIDVLPMATNINVHITMKPDQKFSLPPLIHFAHGQVRGPDAFGLPVQTGWDFVVPVSPPKTTNVLDWGFFIEVWP